jgi:hypothetical protein
MTLGPPKIFIGSSVKCKFDQCPFARSYDADYFVGGWSFSKASPMVKLAAF